MRATVARDRISGWERRHFLQALDADTHLTKGQKEKVRAQIEAWSG